MRIAVVGLGEAGNIYAADLAARGATVTGTDLHSLQPPPGVALADRVAQTVAGAEIIFSLVGATAAESVFDEALEAMDPSAIFADMNTAGPEDKRMLAAKAAARGVAFVDVAILAPVPRARADTPLLLSGSGAARLRPLLEELRIPARDLGDQAGAAASLKLLRSVFMKGLAALVYESVTAARSLGAEDWVLDQIASELGENGHELVDRLVSSTGKHAVRREIEMRDAQSYLDSLGAAHPMTDATIDWLHAIAEGRSHAIPRA